MSKEFVAIVRKLPEGQLRSLIDNSILKAVDGYAELNIASNEDDTDSDDFYDSTVLFLKEDLLEKKEFLKLVILYLEPFLLQEIFDEDSDEKAQNESAYRKSLLNRKTKAMIQRLKSYFGMVTIAKRHGSQEKQSEIIEQNIGLHDFQVRIKDIALKEILLSDNSAHVIHLPTGAGKTRTAMEIVTDFIRAYSLRTGYDFNFNVIWLAQNKELCQQALSTFQFIWSNKGDRPVKAHRYYENFDIDFEGLRSINIFFMSLPKLVVNISNKQFKDIRRKTSLVVVDEAHRSVASKWGNCIDFFAENDFTYLMGLTATPGRSDDESSNLLLSHFFQSKKTSLVDEKYIPIESPMAYLQKREFLANVQREVIYTNVDIKLDDHERRRFLAGEQLSTIQKELSVNPKRNYMIVKAIAPLYEKRKKVLVFTCSTDHNKILNIILNNYGVSSSVIDANTESGERIRLIDEFKKDNSDVNILLNYGVLSTGFDAPKTDACIITRPVGSIVLYSQMVGRIMRGPKNNGNKDNRLITLKDNIDLGDSDEIFGFFDDYWT